MTKEDLKKVKKHLPEGWENTIAEEFNLTPLYIRKVMYNGNYNRAVVERAIEMAIAEKARREEVYAQMKSL